MSDYEDKILPSIELELSSPIKKSIIWLHGLGADGSDFVPVAYELNLPIGVRFIFPHAPIMPVTINNDHKMRAWYDIYSLSSHSKTDVQGIQKSVAEVKKLIEREVERGMETTDILLAGFSQGAAIALSCGITYNNSLGGIIALSGYLPLANEVLKNNKFNTHIPIFLAHGTEDPIVPYALGKATYLALKEAGLEIDWHSYAMGHSVCGEEINDISQWLKLSKHK
jgi:phospholipase/carboxylesterase